jgi:hypothetical protein
MADWVTISSLATAGGTLVLAVATFASVRSANRSARVAERALLVGLRPVLTASRETDPSEQVGFGDEHYLRVGARLGAVEEADGNVYMAIPLRNVGAGLGVLHGWHLQKGRRVGGDPRDLIDNFRRQQLDLYIPPGEIGYWQGAVREEADAFLIPARDSVAEPDAVTIDLLYGDHEGGQRTITRFVLFPSEGDSGGWPVRVLRHWRVEGLDPRPF